LARFPAGYLVLGDAIASFNPTYGQGMTSAAMQAQALDEVLAERPTLDALAPIFFKKAAKVVDMPWQMAVGEDFRFPTTTGPKPPGTDFINRYIAKVNRASHYDEVVGAAFLRVMNLLAPSTSLMHPHIMWRVLRGSGDQAHTTPTVNPARPEIVRG
jgi:2-polyprenyl-6-methoxyphenol hydroxylase-like FAD-dependent oxidoreductase